MKVKVGDKIYDGKKEPVMVILDEEDKDNMRYMPPEESKYCEYPDSYSKEFIKKWMAEIDG